MHSLLDPCLARGAQEWKEEEEWKEVELLATLGAGRTAATMGARAGKPRELFEPIVWNSAVNRKV